MLKLILIITLSVPSFLFTYYIFKDYFIYRQIKKYTSELENDNINAKRIFLKYLNIEKSDLPVSILANKAYDKWIF